MNDIRLPVGDKKRSWTLNIIRDSLTRIFKAIPGIKENAGSVVHPYRLDNPQSSARPAGGEEILVIDAGQISAGRR